MFRLIMPKRCAIIFMNRYVQIPLIILRFCERCTLDINYLWKVNAWIFIICEKYLLNIYYLWNVLVEYLLFVKGSHMDIYDLYFCYVRSNPYVCQSHRVTYKQDCTSGTVLTFKLWIIIYNINLVPRIYVRMHTANCYSAMYPVRCHTSLYTWLISQGNLR